MASRGRRRGGRLIRKPPDCQDRRRWPSLRGVHLAAGRRTRRDDVATVRHGRDADLVGESRYAVERMTFACPYARAVGQVTVAVVDWLPRERHIPPREEIAVPCPPLSSLSGACGSSSGAVAPLRHAAPPAIGTTPTPPRRDRFAPDGRANVARHKPLASPRLRRYNGNTIAEVAFLRAPDRQCAPL